jgi:Tol biopolymer transport system component
MAGWGDSQRRLYRVPAAGGVTEELPMGMLVAEDPHWSPDGRYLAFAGGDDPVDWDLWIWDFQDEALIQLTDTRYPEQSPVWNDAGTEIAYAAVIKENKDVWVAYDLPVGTAAQSTDWSDLRRRFRR